MPGYSTRRRLVLAVLLAVVLLAAIAASARAPSRLTITLKNTGIQVSSTSPAAGQYSVVVKNLASTERGVQITTKDRTGATNVTYSKMLATGGATQTMTVTFPAGGSVVIKDMLACTNQTACTAPRFGGHSVTLKVR